MMMDLDERVERYLDGALSDEETKRFEHDLVDPEVAAAFSEALMFRELIRSAPPRTAPEELVAMIEAAIVEDGGQVTEPERDSLLSRTRRVLDSMAWAYRGPALGMASTNAVASTSREALSGMGTMRYALGPLADRVGKDKDPEDEAAAEERKALWRQRIKKYTLDPLADRVRKGITGEDEEEPAPKQSWWRRIIGRKA